MPSSWIVARPTKPDGRNAGSKRYRVVFRVGGAESRHRYAGSFPTKAEAIARKRWVDGELANMRVPNLAALEAPAVRPVTLREIAERWRASRVDVSDGTAATHRVNLGRILPALGARPVEAVTAADVADLVSTLHAGGMARESIRKTKATLAMVLDLRRHPAEPGS